MPHKRSRKPKAANAAEKNAKDAKSDTGTGSAEPVITKKPDAVQSSDIKSSPNVVHSAAAPPPVPVPVAALKSAPAAAANLAPPLVSATTKPPDPIPAPALGSKQSSNGSGGGGGGDAAADPLAPTKPLAHRLFIYLHAVLDEFHFPKPLISLIADYVPRTVMLVMGGSEWGAGRIASHYSSYWEIYRTILMYDPFVPRVSGSQTAAAAAANSEKDESVGIDSYPAYGAWSNQYPTLWLPEMTHQIQNHWAAPGTGLPPTTGEYCPTLSVLVGDRHLVVYNGVANLWMCDLQNSFPPVGRIKASPNAMRGREGVPEPPAPPRETPTSWMVPPTDPFGASVITRGGLWTPLPPLKHVYSGYGSRSMVWLGNKLYLFISEYSDAMHEQQRAAAGAGHRSSSSFSHVRAYDSGLKKWTDLRSLSAAVQRNMLVVMGRWVVGVSPVGKIVILDSTTEEFFSESQIPIPAFPTKTAGILSGAAMVQWNGGLLVVGGGSSELEPGSVRASCWFWKPLRKGGSGGSSGSGGNEKNVWIRHSKLNYARDRHGLVVMNETVWIVGGRNEYGEAMDSVEYWDLKQQIWKHAAPLLEPRMFPSVVVIN